MHKSLPVELTSGQTNTGYIWWPASTFAAYGYILIPPNVTFTPIFYPLSSLHSYRTLYNNCYTCLCSPLSMQYSSAKDGSALGVAVTRNAMLTHCRSLTTACVYREGTYVPFIVCSHIRLDVSLASSPRPLKMGLVSTACACANL